MTHLPYIVVSYGLAVAVTLWLGIGATVRTAAARGRLRAIDPRADPRADRGDA